MKEALSSLIAAVELREIRTLEGSFRASGPISPSETQLTIRHGADAVLGSGVLKVIAKIGIDGRTKGIGEPTVSVHCAIELTYSLADGFTTNHETASEFARVNGVFNAWPFARSFIHSSFMQMGLPVFVLPVLRLKDLVGPPPKPDEQPKLDAAAE